MNFKPHTIHLNGRSGRYYSKNKAGKRYTYSDEEMKDLLKGGSIFNLKHHYQRFKNFFSLTKKVIHGHGGRKVRDKTQLSKNRKVGAQLAAAAYKKSAPKGFSVYRRHSEGYYTIYKQNTPVGKQARYTISYRGTKVSGSDLYQDLKIAVGKNAPRIKQLEPEIKQFLTNHKKAVVSMAGHSLGSHLALHHFSSMKGTHKNLKNAYLYALPGSPLRVGKHKSDTAKHLSDKRVMVTVRDGDPVSLGMQKPANLVSLKNDSGKLVSLQNHGTKNFST